MRIGFDGRALVSPAAGVRRYTHELFTAMAALGGVEVVAVGVPANAPVPAGVSSVPASASLPTNLGWMATGLPRAARHARLDLFHAPSYTAPLGGPRPLVLTIHDVSYQRHPEWYPYRRDPVRRAFYRWSAKTADRVVTDSEFSKQEIIAAYGLPAGGIDVVPLAAAGVFTPGAGARPQAPFVLHVGDIHVRRNLGVVVRAIARIRARRADLAPLRLVLAGVDRGALASLHEAAGDATGMIEHFGYVSEAQLVDRYRAASALVYPSLYEGFGIPLLEAMACGTPVLAARAASIPEVVADAGVLLDPVDVEAWADAIERVFDPPTAASLRASGLRRASSFTWQRTAEATLAVYRRALEGGR